MSRVWIRLCIAALVAPQVAVTTVGANRSYIESSALPNLASVTTVPVTVPWKANTSTAVIPTLVSSIIEAVTSFRGSDAVTSFRNSDAATSDHAPAPTSLDSSAIVVVANVQAVTITLLGALSLYVSPSVPSHFSLKVSQGRGSELLHCVIAFGTMLLGTSIKLAVRQDTTGRTLTPEVCFAVGIVLCLGGLLSENVIAAANSMSQVKSTVLYLVSFALMSLMFDEGLNPFKRHQSMTTREDEDVTSFLPMLLLQSGVCTCGALTLVFAKDYDQTSVSGIGSIFIAQTILAGKLVLRQVSGILIEPLIAQASFTFISAVMILMFILLPRALGVWILSDDEDCGEDSGQDGYCESVAD